MDTGKGGNRLATKAKQKVINPIDQMPLAELQARRTQIAEQLISSNVHWEIDKDGNYHSMLDKTDYWKIKEKIDQWK
jgi:hypothetical protein